MGERTGWPSDDELGLRSALMSSVLGIPEQVRSNFLDVWPTAIADYLKEDIPKMAKEPGKTVRNAVTKGLTVNLAGIPGDLAGLGLKAGQMGADITAGLLNLPPQYLTKGVNPESIPMSSAALEHYARQKGLGPYIDPPEGSSSLLYHGSNLLAAPAALGALKGAGKVAQRVAELPPTPAAGSRAAQAGMIDLRRSPRVADRNAEPVFPGIYDDPRVIVANAAARAAPESPALPELFGVTRTDLDRATLEQQSHALASDVYQPTRPPEHVQQITVPGNARRLQDTLELASEEPKLAGSYGWYMGDPLFHEFVNELGPVQGAHAYDRFHQFGATFSPQSAVIPEIERSSLAYSKDRQGKLIDIYNDKSLMPVYKGPVRRMEQTGNFLTSDLTRAPKTRVYKDSRTGENYFHPTGDAHYIRAIGLPDVRPFTKGKFGEFGPSVGSIEATEVAPISDWYARDVAGPLGMTGSPAQALQWNVFGPATGVKTPLSAPYLELFANQVVKTAKRKGITPKEALRQWIRGEGDKLGKNEKSQLLEAMTGMA